MPDTDPERDERLARADALREIYWRHADGTADCPGVGPGDAAVRLTALVLDTLLADPPGEPVDDGAPA